MGASSEIDELSANESAVRPSATPTPSRSPAGDDELSIRSWFGAATGRRLAPRWVRATREPRARRRAPPRPRRAPGARPPRDRAAAVTARPITSTSAPAAATSAGRTDARLIVDVAVVEPHTGNDRDEVRTRACCTRAISCTEHTTPPQPDVDRGAQPRVERGRVGIAREHRDRDRNRRARRPLRRAPFGHAFDAGAQHRRHHPPRGSSGTRHRAGRARARRARRWSGCRAA